MEIKPNTIIDFKTEKPYLHHPFGVEISEREWSGWNELEHHCGFEPFHIPLKPRLCMIEENEVQGERKPHQPDL